MKSIKVIMHNPMTETFTIEKDNDDGRGGRLCRGYDFSEIQDLEEKGFKIIKMIDDYENMLEENWMKTQEGTINEKTNYKTKNDYIK